MRIDRLRVGMQLAVGGAAIAFGLVASSLYLGNVAVTLVAFLLVFCFFAWARGAWMVVVPTALVAGSAYPVTGSLLVSPGDLVVFAAVASVFFGNTTWKLDRKLTTAFVALLVVSAVGAARGWQSLPESSWENQLNLYLTRLNSIYVFKGYVLGALLAGAYFTEWNASSARAWSRLSLGVQASAIVVAVFVLIERSMAFGVFDFRNELRASGPFFSMHIGGQHIDGYWSLAFPFLLFTNRSYHDASWLRVAWKILAGAMAVYAIFGTMSRSTVALGCATVLVFALFSLTSTTLSRSARRSAAIHATVLLVATVGIGIVSVALHKRFSATRESLDRRISHWQSVREVTDNSNALVGRGLGTYPVLFREHQGYSNSLYASRAVSTNDSDGGILIQPHSDCYLEQWVSRSAPGPWRIRMEFAGKANNASKPPLRVIVCNKTLLQSFECVDSDSLVRNRSDSASKESCVLQVDLSKLNQHRGERGNHLPTPTTLAIVGASDSPVLLHEIEVVDANGHPVIRNGDFSNGSRSWFFTSDDHLVWRTKNTWANLRIEQGWLGIIAWGMLLLLVIARAVTTWPKRSKSNEFGVSDRDGILSKVNQERALVGVTAIVGWLSMSVFGTMVDTPWIVGLTLSVFAAVAVASPVPFSRTVLDDPASQVL